jgi:hypothetical protein
MKRGVFGCSVGALASLALAALVSPARADFYSLDGRFQCLDHANAICGDPEPLAALPRALPPAPPAAPPAPAAAPAPAPAPAAPAPVAHIAPPMPRPEDPLHAVAQRVQAGTPASGDIAWLRQAAQNGNARAIELLAWCDLNAIGTPRDTVKAYLLYGAAADAALPHARENQALIYERDLSSVQRQQVLDLVNEGVALAQLSPAAQ